MEHLAVAVLALRGLQSPLQTAATAGMALPQASLEHRSLTLAGVAALVMRLLAEVQTAQAEQAGEVMATIPLLALMEPQILAAVVAVVVAHLEA